MGPFFWGDFKADPLFFCLRLICVASLSSLPVAVPVSLRQVSVLPGRKMNRWVLWLLPLLVFLQAQVAASAPSLRSRKDNQDKDDATGAADRPGAVAPSLAPEANIFKESAFPLRRRPDEKKKKPLTPLLIRDETEVKKKELPPWMRPGEGGIEILQNLVSLINPNFFPKTQFQKNP